MSQNTANQPILTATALETWMGSTNPMPLYLPQIEDPNQSELIPSMMVDDPIETNIWQGTMKTIPAQQINLQEGLNTTFMLYRYQCSPTLRSKLEQLTDWPPKSLIWQIKYIRNIVCARESHHKPVYSMVQLLKALLNF